MTITDLERQGLQGIINSDYQDGCAEADKHVWTWSANPFKSKKTFSGVMSSLVKKGLAGSYEDGRDSTVWITTAGMDALKNS